LIVSAVDNSRARRSIAEAILAWSEGRLSNRSPNDQLWWLDASHGLEKGLITLGNSFVHSPLLSSAGVCRALPLPHLQEPHLCKEETSSVLLPPLAPLEHPDPPILRAMEAWIGFYLYRLLQGKLDLMATRINLRTGLVYSAPITAPWPILSSKPAQSLTLGDLNFASSHCPGCGNKLVRSHTYHQGIQVGQLSCSQCPYRVEVCPECEAGRIEHDEINQNTGAEPVLCCSACDWTVIVPPPHRSFSLTTQHAHQDRSSGA
jgi:hypothetical protein